MDQGALIVPEKLLRLARSPGLRRTLLAAVLPFVGVVAAFGIAPDTVTEQIPSTRIVEEVVLEPAVSDASSTEETYWREERVQRGDTIASLLTRLRVDDPHAVRFLRASKEARGLRQLVPGRMVRAETAEDGRLVELRYSTGVMMLVATAQGDDFVVKEQVAPLERRLVMASGEIKSSLFAATDTANLNESVADQLAQIFSTDIDFHKDLRRGDRFTVVYEMYYDTGEAVKSGRILAAELVNDGKAYQAVWFQHANGRGDYYSLDGKPIKKTFLRSPLEFSRISSGFTAARFHPVLQRSRAHTGIDYAAPAGTGVKAVADAVVEFAGQQNGYGNVVVLRHEKRYTTLYGHLSGFGPNVRTGALVSQGDVIGYVGMSGLATGPHLHFEFKIDDVHVDPQEVAMPEVPVITADHRAAFEAVARPLALRLGLLRGTKLAQSD
jgi:murein DD-endopeptidase MepM/ murein hydrolase activator NlpD